MNFFLKQCRFMAIHTFWPPIVWVYLHSNFCGGLRKTHLFYNSVCVSAVQGHRRSLILPPIERAYATSINSNFQTQNSNSSLIRTVAWKAKRDTAINRYKPTTFKTLVLSCTVSEIRRLIGWKLRIFPTPLSFNALARGEPFRISGWTFYPEN